MDRLVPICGSLFLTYALATSHSLYSAIYLATLAVAFVIGYRDRLEMLRVGLGYCVLASLAILPAIAFEANPNYIGCVLALGLAIAIAYRIWVFIPIAIGGLAYSQSRGAILAAGVAIFIVIWQDYKVLAIALAVGVFFLLAEIIHGSGGADSILARLGIWQDTLNHLTIFGSGFGSFADAYPGFSFHTNMTETRASHAYNDFLELVFELGIGVIPLWFLITFAFESEDWQAKLVLTTFGVLSLTYFPFYISILGHAFALTLGRLVANPSAQPCLSRNRL